MKKMNKVDRKGTDRNKHTNTNVNADKNTDVKTSTNVSAKANDSINADTSSHAIADTADCTPVSNLAASVKEEAACMTYEKLFQEVKEIFMKADVSNIKGHLAYQFNIEGEGEGAFYAEVKDGQLAIEPYEYYDRDVVFTMTGKTLLKIAKKKLDPVLAFTIGQLKFEGDVDKALMIQKFL